MTSASIHARESCGAPASGNAGWDIADQHAMGTNPVVLGAMAQAFVSRPEANVHAILIARKGKLIFEQYYSGDDKEWGKGLPPAKVDFGPDTPHDLRSISKSIVALLVGIGLEQRWIAGIDSSVLAHLPNCADLRTPEKDHITLRHLLTMAPGLDWNEDVPFSDPENSDAQMIHASDPCRFVLSRPMISEPGQIWTYCGGAATVIAGLLEAATGKRIDRLAKENLFEPLGIDDAQWAKLPGSGLPAAAVGLRMRPLDTLKIGQVVLSGGLWRGHRVLPEHWIKAATSPQINAPGAMFYGFQFWLGRSLVDLQEIRWIAAMGFGGQRLYIVPSLDLVALVHAGLYASGAEDAITSMILRTKP